MTNFRQGTELQTIHICDVDPTVPPGIPGGTPNLLLLRTDDNSLYYFVGPLDTDWNRCGVGTVPPPPAPPASTDGGEAGVIGTGTALDPFIPVGGPFRPVTDVFVMDDYHVSYGPQPSGVSSTLGVGYTSVLKSGAGSQFSCNDAAGYLGPGVGSMMGVMDLQLIAATAGQYITAVQARQGTDDGSAVEMPRLQGNYDLWWSARVSFEGTADFEVSQKAFAGFSRQIDTPAFGSPERAYFHPKDNGSQINWFATYNIPDDNGANIVDIDTGIRVGFTADHPLDGRAAQNLLVLFRHHDPGVGGVNCSLTMAIDGVIALGPVEFVNPQARFSPMCAIQSILGSQSNTMYVDWMLWGIKGRTI